MNPTGTAIAVQVRHQTAMDADFAHRNHPLALATTVQARLQVYQQLRQQYPNASLTAELVSVQGEQFVVRAQVEIAGQTLATGLGAATQIEEAEDRARLRVLELLGLSPERIAPSQWEVQVVAQATPVLSATANDRILEAASTSMTAPAAPAIASELESEIPAFDAVEAELEEVTPAPRVVKTPPVERDRPKPSQPQPAATSAELPLLDLEPAPTAPLSAVPTDWSEDLAEIEVELKRLMWTEAEEQAYLLQHFGKRSRALIADYDQLLLFLDHLRSLPTPGLTPATPVAAEPEPVRSVSLPPVPTPAPATPPAIAPPEVQPNRSEAMELTSAAVKRLGWTNRQGSDHLRQTYGKASRQQLTTEELLDFLHYLHRLSPPPSTEAVPF